MRLRSVTLVALVLSPAALGCSKHEPAPPDLRVEYQALLGTLDDDLPGASASRLAEFMNANRKYDIVTEVETEIARLRSLADGRYHEARELAREGDFDRAEGMLQDLATYLSDTPDGESAKEHLAFNFYLGKAQWLMVRQRWEEGADVVRPLLERDLTRVQREQVETILDGAGVVGAAYSQAERDQTRAATRHLVIYLETRNADEGAYPSRLSLSDVEDWDPVGSRSILRALSAIEGYQRTDRGYSFVAVSASKQHRVRVVDGTIED
jgi:hypothetical protein